MRRTAFSISRRSRPRPPAGRALTAWIWCRTSRRRELRLARDDLDARGRLWRARGAALQGGGAGFRREAQHPAPAGRRRLRRDGRARNGQRRGYSGAQAGWRLPVQRPRRPGGNRQIRRADHPEDSRGQNPDLRHLSRPSDDGAGGRREDDENASGPPRRQSSGAGFHHRQGGDRLDEPRFRGRSGQPAGKCGRDAQVAVRRHQLRHRPDRPPGFFGAASPRSLARPAGQPLSFRALCRDDGKGQGG